MKKYFVLLFLVGVFIFSSFIALAGNFFNETDEDGNIVLVPFTGAVVTGLTEAGSVVLLSDFSYHVGDDGVFLFEKVEPGTYLLYVSHDDFDLFSTEIKVVDGERLDLGFVSLTGNNNVVDVSDPSYLDDFNIEKERSSVSGQPLSGKFALGSPELSYQLAYLFMDYERGIDGKNSDVAKFSSYGFSNALGVELPLLLWGYPFGLEFDYCIFDGKNDMEKVFVNDELNTLLMVDVSGFSFRGSVFYKFQFQPFSLKVSLGTFHFKEDLDMSIFELSKDPERFTKEYYYGQGWSFGGSVFSDLPVKGLLEDLNIGASFFYTASLVEVTSTKYYSNDLVRGHNTDFDVFLGYDTPSFDFRLGYKFVRYYSGESIDGLHVFPAMTKTYQGPSFSFVFQF